MRNIIWLFTMISVGIVVGVSTPQFAFGQLDEEMSAEEALADAEAAKAEAEEAKKELEKKKTDLKEQEAMLKNH